VKKLLLLIGLVTGGLAAFRSWRMRQADAQLWQEATAPRDLR
jgi:hypothetical protein